MFALLPLLCKGQAAHPASRPPRAAAGREGRVAVGSLSGCARPLPLEVVSLHICPPSDGEGSFLPELLFPNVLFVCIHPGLWGFTRGPWGHTGEAGAVSSGITWCRRLWEESFPEGLLGGTPRPGGCR